MGRHGGRPSLKWQGRISEPPSENSTVAPSRIRYRDNGRLRDAALPNCDKNDCLESRPAAYTNHDAEPISG